MKHESLRKLGLEAVSILLLAIFVATGWAQEPPKKPTTGPPGKPVVSQETESKKLRGRLPAYYGKVVSEKQRQEIYKIQAQYNEQILKLKEQLESMTTKRDTEVAQVLTDQQRAEVAKLKEARRGGSGSSTEASSTSSGQ